MAKALSLIQLRLAVVTTLSFALAPLLGYTLAGFFGLIDSVAIFNTKTGIYISIGYFTLCGWVAWHFWYFTRPIMDWHTEHPQIQNPPEKLQQHLTGFTTNYWSFYLTAILLLPMIQQWTGVNTTAANPAYGLLEFMLLQLVVAIFVGMPGYLYSLTLLGYTSRYIGLASASVSLQSKMLLIGAYLPILITAVLMKYYWWRTGFIPSEILLAWGLICIVSVVISITAIHSLRQSLAPVKKFIHRGGASSNRMIASQLRPQSRDEIGYLTQMLGNLFKRLVDQESHVTAIVDNAAEGIVVLDEEQHIDMLNPAAEQIFGYSAQEIRGKPLRWLIPTINAATCDRDNFIYENEVYARHSNGSSIPISVRISQMHNDNKLFYTLLVADISERKAAEELLLEAEARYRNLVETAHDLVFSIDPQGHWTYLNSAVTAIYGFQPPEMLGHHFHEYQAPESRERDETAFAQLLAGKELVQYETVHLDHNGDRRYISFNARPAFDSDGDITQISGTARDITDQKQFEQELTYQAQHDTLTGLHNRSYFQSELERVISRIARSGAECALLYLDLDQFKYVNDTLGHAAGDRLLKECTDLLRKNTREGDLLARFGGDEFTILLYQIEHEHVMPVAENIRRMFEHYCFMDSGRSINVTCSIGLTMITSDTESADVALSHADLACNISKSQGRNCVHEYSQDDSAQNSMAEDMGWVALVKDALHNDRFELLYQPIVKVSTQDISGYEVLLRLPTEDGQSIKPGGFIPAAERFGLVHNIDRWAVSRSMEYLSQLHSQNVHTQFSINLSGRAVDDAELLKMIKSILNDTGLNPASLLFEITETAAIANMRAARKFIGQLKDLGCRMALDDFGSGFCSFTYLKHLPVDSLKIDGSFVQGLASAKVDQAMVQSMNQVAHALGKTTIAEFVENQETLRLLQLYGVDYAQGHFIGKPRSFLLHSVSDTTDTSSLSA